MSSLSLFALAELPVGLPNFILKVRLEFRVESFLDEIVSALDPIMASDWIVRLVTHRISIHPGSKFCLLLSDQLLGKTGAFYHELDLTGTLHQGEQIGGLINSAASGQKTMILEHHDPTSLTQRISNSIALLGTQDHSAE